MFVILGKLILNIVKLPPYTMSLNAAAILFKVLWFNTNPALNPPPVNLQPLNISLIVSNLVLYDKISFIISKELSKVHPLKWYEKLVEFGILYCTILGRLE